MKGALQLQGFISFIRKGKLYNLIFFPAAIKGFFKVFHFFLPRCQADKILVPFCKNLQIFWQAKSFFFSSIKEDLIFYESILLRLRTPCLLKIPRSNEYKLVQSISGRIHIISSALMDRKIHKTRIITDRCPFINMALQGVPERSIRTNWHFSTIHSGPKSRGRRTLVIFFLGAKYLYKTLLKRLDNHILYENHGYYLEFQIFSLIWQILKKMEI